MKMFLCICAMLLTATTFASDLTIDFAKGKWDKSKWTAIKVLPQKQPLDFQQENNCISVDVTEEQVKAKIDNAVMVTDTGNASGQFDVTFSIDGKRGTAPGILISPQIKNGVLEKAIAIFIAEYAVVIWMAEKNKAGDGMNYTQLARFVRYQAPQKKHTIYVSYQQRLNNLAIKIDDSSIIGLRTPGLKINSLVGIWGCHGKCSYYKAVISKKATLPLAAIRKK